MNKSNNFILNRLFTQNIFMDLINNNCNTVYNTCIQRYLEEINSFNNEVLINKVYGYMGKKYRNEYFYKNTLLNKLLLGRHSLKTTTALSEVPINKSKADFILINGKAVVYEIKTGLDTFERLDNQINDYYKAFDHVCVVTCESNYKKLSGILKDTKVGIYILTDRNTISVRKESIEERSFLDYPTIFKILRKKEFENILLDYYGELPHTTQVNYYKECLKLFTRIDIEILYEFFIRELKKRNIKEIEEYNKVPYELKFMVYFSKFKKNDYLKLHDFLHGNWGG
ncbi:sce7726 family protein [Peribacillus sp. TH27]|uniref:sce7726 family protein n=1 Tax=Peribacillus sp. TH27 TaxID=2798484 RepID=UPI00191278F9|nr:sce7726 family protein [Peribacillus sp. TH27]MBK5458047.1 sce7726 family protein [Peribacillus sp. TH27]